MLGSMGVRKIGEEESDRISMVWSLVYGGK
jgi:hypothetical protein